MLPPGRTAAAAPPRTTQTPQTTQGCHGPANACRGVGQQQQACNVRRKVDAQGSVASGCRVSVLLLHALNRRCDHLMVLLVVHLHTALERARLCVLIPIKGCLATASPARHKQLPCCLQLQRSTAAAAALTRWSPCVLMCHCSRSVSWCGTSCSRSGGRTVFLRVRDKEAAKRVVCVSSVRSVSVGLVGAV